MERMLTDIDQLPHQFQSAEIVYLSKNCLTDLEVCLHNTSRADAASICNHDCDPAVLGPGQ